MVFEFGTLDPEGLHVLNFFPHYFHGPASDISQSITDAQTTDGKHWLFPATEAKGWGNLRSRIVWKIMFAWSLTCHFRYISTHSEYKGLETVLPTYVTIVLMNLQQSQLSECICQNFMPSHGLSLSLWDRQVQTKDSSEHSDSSISRAHFRIRLRIR